MGQLVKDKENSEFKPVKPRLKIDLVSYPARAEGLVNMITNSKMFIAINLLLVQNNEAVIFSQIQGHMTVTNGCVPFSAINKMIANFWRLYNGLYHK